MTTVAPTDLSDLADRGVKTDQSGARRSVPGAFPLYDDIDRDGPQLLLTVGPSGGWRVPDNGRTFEFLMNQTAGHACLHPHVIATRLAWNKPARIAAEALCARWSESMAGGFGTVSLKTANRYANDLEDLFDGHVSCNGSYHELQEGWYPLDPTKGALAHLTSETLPDDLDDLVEFSSPVMRLAGVMGRWGLVIAGPNCD